MTRWPLCIAINHSCCHPHKCHSRLIYKPSMVGGCCIIALAIAFRGDSNPFFLGAMGSNELYIWNSKFICDFFLTFHEFVKDFEYSPKVEVASGRNASDCTALPHSASKRQAVDQKQSRTTRNPSRNVL